MADIFETCELINQYIEESKGNALDKLYGKKWDEVTKYAALADKAKEIGMPRHYIDKLNQKSYVANNEYSDAINKHSSADLSKNLYKGMSNLANRHDLLLTRAHKGKNKKLDDNKIEALRVMKQELGHGLGKNKDSESDKYLKMQKEIDKINGVKRESTDARLNIYEAFESGLITEFEKTELLNILDNTYEE